MANRQVQYYNVGTATATWLIWSKTINVKDFQQLDYTITMSWTGTATIKVYGSMQETMPDLTTSASATNQYSPIQSINLDTWATVNGSTWLVYAWASDWTATYEININALNWIGFSVTAYTQWTITINAMLTTNL